MYESGKAEISPKKKGTFFPRKCGRHIGDWIFIVFLGFCFPCIAFKLKCPL